MRIFVVHIAIFMFLVIPTVLIFMSWGLITSVPDAIIFLFGLAIGTPIISHSILSKYFDDPF